MCVMYIVSGLIVIFANFQTKTLCRLLTQALT
ncbi:MAG: hypothetical protein ACSW8D_11010 [Prevotella sp.]